LQLRHCLPSPEPHRPATITTTAIIGLVILSTTVLGWIVESCGKLA
jgi:hypothetical protein